MAVKFIASDLDGTLMSPDHLTVSERTKKALFDAHKNGVKIAVATGRTYSLIESVLEQIPFVDYVIYSNGASVYDRNSKKDVYQNHISPENTAEIVDFLADLPIYYNVYIDGGIYIPYGRDEYYTETSLPKEFLDDFLSRATVCRDIKQAVSERSSEIFAVYSVNKEQKAKLNAFFSTLGLEVTSSLENELEATAMNVNKGNALKGVCDLLGIKADEVMAFGDAGNDIPMLKYAGYSFAMGNATKECKASAAYLTETNAKDGVAVMVEKYALGR